MTYRANIFSKNVKIVKKGLAMVKKMLYTT